MARMSYRKLPYPGTEYGPCVNDCAHVGCARNRRMAAALCMTCERPIGYGEKFWSYGWDPSFAEHKDCAESEVTKDAGDSWT